MPRPLTIHEKPVFVPYVCIQCGLGEGRREWFVDLGFAIDAYFDTNNQAIYLCNECFNNMTLEVGRLLQVFRKDHEKWEGEEPTYHWFEGQELNDIRESESVGSTGGIEGTPEDSTGVDSSSDGNDQDTEPNDSEPESTDSGDANSVDDSDSDESARKTITASFGEG